jgi:predicted kinase
MDIVSPDTHLINKDGIYEWSPSRATQAWDRAYEEFHLALIRCSNHVQVNTNALLLVGIPGSGKTTFLTRDNDIWTSVERDRSVVFDATLTSSLSRRPLIEMAAEAGVRIEAVVFDVPLIAAMRRNAARPPERRVPSDTMFRMARQLEEEPPTLREGFWRITSSSPW